MYNWLKEDELFWKGYYGYHFGRKSLQIASQHKKKHKTSWKERTKTRFYIIKNRLDFQGSITEIETIDENVYDKFNLNHHFHYNLAVDLQILKEYKYCEIDSENLAEIKKLSIDNFDPCYYSIQLLFQENEKMCCSDKQMDLGYYYDPSDIPGNKNKTISYSIQSVTLRKPCKLLLIDIVHHLDASNSYEPEIFEFVLDGNHSFKKKFSKTAFDLLKFFRFRNDKNVLLEFVRLRYKYVIVGWEYQ